jgi:hypothetical protein
MRVIRLTIAIAGLLLMAACGGFPFWRARPESEEKAFCEGDAARDTKGRGRAELELRNIHYDGDTLAGTLLIGAVGGNLCLDKRMIPGMAVSADGVWDCTPAISNPVPFMVVDYYVSPLRHEDVLILESGYWYGAPVRVPLFVTEQPAGKRNPDCVEVSLTLYPLQGGPAGRVRVRARRDSPAPADAGVTPEAEPSPDDVNPGRVWVPYRDEQ